METMIERVARTLRTQDGGNSDETCVGDGKAAGDTGFGWRAFFANDRIVIAARHERADDLVETGEDAAKGVWDRMAARYVQNTMVGAARTER